MVEAKVFIVDMRKRERGNKGEGGRERERVIDLFIELTLNLNTIQTPGSGGI